MENLPYFVIFNEFSIFLGVFTRILSCLDPKMAVNAQIITQGCVLRYIISLYTDFSRLGSSGWRICLI